MDISDIQPQSILEEPLDESKMSMMDSLPQSLNQTPSTVDSGRSLFITPHNHKPPRGGLDDKDDSLLEREQTFNSNASLNISEC